jgi:hypothetical protein
MNTPFILSGSSSKGPKKDYSLPSDTQSRMFGIFNAIAIIATTYGNGMIPEIQVFAILKVNRCNMLSNVAWHVTFIQILFVGNKSTTCEGEDV